MDTRVHSTSHASTPALSRVESACDSRERSVSCEPDSGRRLRLRSVLILPALASAFDANSDEDQPLHSLPLTTYQSEPFLEDQGIAPFMTPQLSRRKQFNRLRTPAIGTRTRRLDEICSLYQETPQCIPSECTSPASQRFRGRNELSFERRRMNDNTPHAKHPPGMTALTVKKPQATRPRLAPISSSTTNTSTMADSLLLCGTKREDMANRKTEKTVPRKPQTAALPPIAEPKRHRTPPSLSSAQVM